MIRTWWLSFADDGKSRGIVLIDDAENIADAVLHASLLGCNPGGEVAGLEIPASVFMDAESAEAKWLQTAERGRVYQRADLPFDCCNCEGDPR